MMTIAEFRFPASDSALGATFNEIPSLECEIEQVIAADDFSIWLHGADLARINTALRADETVTTYSVITGDEESWLYNVQFTDEVEERISIVVEERGTLLAATATNGAWTIRLRFPAQGHISRVYDRLTDRGIQIDIRQLQPVPKTTVEKSGLTPEQYEALTAAIQYGYFEIPREISMEELAAELEISHQALSERFRRAYHTLITSELEITENGGRRSVENSRP